MFNKLLPYRRQWRRGVLCILNIIESNHRQICGDPVAMELGLADDPLRTGLALMSGLSAFRFFYLALAPSTLVVGILDGLSILAGLACSYLMIAQGATAWVRQGEPP